MTRFSARHLTRRPIVIGLLLVATLFTTVLIVSPVAANLHINQGRQSRIQRFQPQTLQQMVRSHELASTVQVLASQPPSVIVQFPLFPSGVKKAFPKASGVVTIVQGNPEVSLFDTVTVDVQNMPPDTTFTIFFIEHANKPFGHVQYVADLHTRSDGTGDVTFQTITLVAFAAVAENPGVSQDQSGAASGIQLEHLGMWFSSLQDAQKVLNDSTLKGTPFDGGNPPLHAGPQAMTDGQTDPVF
ncbi:MAG TPA: hypothetical protein VKV37_11755 [Ktedonobacteraceae bacterium]|jgi:hypothetical protein|nr:hypothetical protein [Ktedonobacteraceae bacterium]